jgi:hypothetical protein
MKPLGHKSYGSIGHLHGSRIGPGDHMVHEGQSKIATKKLRDKHDTVIVQEKLDGSNVSIARIDGVITPLQRKGYLAISSPYLQRSTRSLCLPAGRGTVMRRVARPGPRHPLRPAA